MLFGECAHVYGVAAPMAASLIRSADRLPIIVAGFAPDEANELKSSARPMKQSVMPKRQRRQFGSMGVPSPPLTITPNDSEAVRDPAELGRYHRRFPIAP